MGVHLLAVVGLVFILVFLAIRFKLTNVSGEVDSKSDIFQENIDQSQILGETVTADESTESAEIDDLEAQISNLNSKKMQKIGYLCNLDSLSYRTPKNAGRIIAVHKLTKSEFIASQMIFAVKTHLVDTSQFEDEVTNCQKTFEAGKLSEDTISLRIAQTNSQNIFSWSEAKEWSDVKESITKDREIIKQAAEIAGIEPRLVVSSLIVEQLRLFYSQRELYKKFFEPLKILANSNKISLGVMSIKEETAIEIENHLKDQGSPYYLGPKYEHLLDYPEGVEVAAERYKRLTANDHRFNYLYGALYLKQFIVQWKNAGFDLTKRPEILTTLFNVGFPQSKPSSNPKMGGSTIMIGETKYSFGRLGYEFYYSGEMVDEFTYINNL